MTASQPLQLRPSTTTELCDALRRANQTGSRIERVELGALTQIREHTPEDLTVTVEAGLTLAELQNSLRRHGQWLPIDPPHADQLTLAKLLSHNRSGPRRFGFGTIRDHLIGLEVILADGRVVHSGGKVVKNVAGFDLMKLFIGAKDSLGIITEANFKLMPLPETESILHARFDSVGPVIALLEAVRESPLQPVVLDLVRATPGATFDVVLGLAGTREEVEWQKNEASRLGVRETGSISYDSLFWSPQLPEPHRLSVLPSRLADAVRNLGDIPFVARAGNGIVYHRGERPPPNDSAPESLLDRVKNTFDPNHIFSERP